MSSPIVISLDLKWMEYCSGQQIITSVYSSEIPIILPALVLFKSINTKILVCSLFVVRLQVTIALSMTTLDRLQFLQVGLRIGKATSLLIYLH